MAAQSSQVHSDRSSLENSVFLSFHGETRNTFVSNLKAAFDQAEIKVFTDDQGLERGEIIEEGLKRAIRESSISIVVFSENYATSSWCLFELKEIMSQEAKIIPIFHHIEPSQVRKQTGSFETAFDQHCRNGIEQDKIEEWRGALAKAGNTAGYHIPRDKKESDCIQEIVSEVGKILPEKLPVPQRLFGLDECVADVCDLLCLDENDVRIIGICGMGGIGKTIIAKVIYNKMIGKFDCICFKTVAKQHDGLTCLHKTKISQVLKTRTRLCSKKTLLVIDDVDNINQELALAGVCDRFGPGSRIIITTRVKGLLDQLDVKMIYKVNLLGEDDSLSLFSFHASEEQMRPDTAEFREFSDEVVGYADGLPLALEVLGHEAREARALFTRGRNSWQRTFDSWKQIHSERIVETLKTSLDTLDKEQAVFLDIACFFVGIDKDYIIDVLDGPDSSTTETRINCLADNFLLLVNQDNKLTMHNLLRDMGREIVRQECTNDLEGRSRLWISRDVRKALTNIQARGRTENLKIEAIVPVNPMFKETEVNTKELSRMQNLRLLQINNVYLTGEYSLLPQALHWICWHYCPLPWLPSEFNPINLVHLDLQHSDITTVWQGSKVLENLKILNLSNCKNLKCTPDVSGLLGLKKLLLEGCSSLEEVHCTLQKILDTLAILDLTGCKNLRNLPCTDTELRSKTGLIIKGWQIDKSKIE